MRSKFLITLLVIFGILFLIGYFGLPTIILKDVPLTDEEDACLGELIEIGFDPGQDWGIIKISSKEGNNINLHLYTLAEFNHEWVAECPGGSIRPKD